MAITVKHNETEFGVGDRIRVVQKIREGEKERRQAFEGMVLSISGREENRSFTVRRIGTSQIGIERIFPLFSPTVEEITVLKKGVKGVRRAKLYYTRHESPREIAQIYARAARRENPSKK